MKVKCDRKGRFGSETKAVIGKAKPRTLRKADGRLIALYSGLQMVRLSEDRCRQVQRQQPVGGTTRS